MRSLAVFVLLCFGASAVGGLFTAPEIEGWYATLAKPSWNPPNAVFGPVWSVLYLLMAIAAWLVWRRLGWPAARLPLSFFFLQLTLNVLWTWIFFRQRQLGAASIEIVVLWLGILATILLFRRTRPLAAWLLVPYLAWVSFATALTFSIWRLNS